MASDSKDPSPYHPVIQELQQYLTEHPHYAAMVQTVLAKGATPQNTTEMFDFLDSVLTLTPTADNTMAVPLWFYQYAITEEGSELLKLPLVNEWIRKWLNAWTEYLDSPASTEGIASWLDSGDSMHSVDLKEYIVPEDGFQSFNAFFCREIKPEVRPIHFADDHSVITSPADAILDYVIHDALSIDSEERFLVKGIEFNVLEILGNDHETAAKYEGGTLMLLSLYFHNYHHYHSYCDSEVKDIGILGGYYFSFGFHNADIVNNCSLEDIPACHAYCSHVNRRGIVDVECRGNGQSSFDSTMVAVGLGHVSSVQFEMDIGERVKKGQRVGHFAYGGSTMILLFPRGVIESVVPEIGTELKVGQPLAKVTVKDSLRSEL